MGGSTENGSPRRRGWGVGTLGAGTPVDFTEAQLTNSDLNYTPRSLAAWLRQYHEGALVLPKFQRSYVWDKGKIKDLLKALLLGRPVGALLLIRDNQERFASRPLNEGAGTGPNTNEMELVLDGQQRLRSLWAALGSSSDIVVRVEDWQAEVLKLEGVYTLGDMKIRTTATPSAMFEKLCFPVNILGIDRVTQEKHAAWSWCNSARENRGNEAHSLLEAIQTSFGEPLRNRNLWQLTLPTGLSREEAIDVYIKTNQSSAIIKRFDLAVALYDSRTQGSLRENIMRMVEKLAATRSLIHKFFDYDSDDQLIPELGEVLMKVACLWSCLTPTASNYTKDAVIATLEGRLEELGDALVWALEFYTREGIVQAGHVPSEVPLRVLPALYPSVKEDPHPLRNQARKERILRAYLWRSILTERYSQAANTRLHEDYRELKKVLENPESIPVVDGAKLKGVAPVFDESHYPLPKGKDLWSIGEPLASPKNKNTRSRALFAIGLRGAQDFLTGERWGLGDSAWDYHHLFPQKYLQKHFKAKEVNHCLNMAYITRATNNRLGSRPPHEWLADGSDVWAQAAGDLRSFVLGQGIPVEALAKAPDRTPGGVDDVKGQYQAFLRARAEMVVKAAKELAEGRSPVVGG